MNKTLDKLTYVDQAEKVIKTLQVNKNGVIAISTNKIRNMLTLLNELYNAVKNQNNELLNIELQSRIQYTKMKLIYEAGRDEHVKELLNNSNLIEYINDIGNSKEKLILVCHYMEAMVAYHKYNTKEK